MSLVLTLLIIVYPSFDVSYSNLQLHRHLKLQIAVDKLFLVLQVDSCNIVTRVLMTLSIIFPLVSCGFFFLQMPAFIGLPVSSPVLFCALPSSSAQPKMLL